MHKYITGIITAQGAKSLAVGGWKDHVHIFFGLPVTISIAEFMKIIKSNSSKWVNEQGFIKGRFSWQAGYSVFSYAKSQRDVVIRYIMNQEVHHANKTFKEEYTKMLLDFEIEFNDKYLFEFFE